MSYLTRTFLPGFETYVGSRSSDQWCQHDNLTLQRQRKA